MADTVYRVLLDLSVQGSFGTQIGSLGDKLGRSHREVSRLGEGIARFGEGAASSLERVNEKVFSLADHLGKAALVGGVGAAAYGVAHLNNQLEQTQISLGAIAQAQGFTTTFEGGFKAAGDQLAKMKQDVKTLPGDLGQLSDIMKMIATPAAQGGANMDQIRQLAGRTMLTGTILGVPLDVAQREMAGLLSGRAGAHNIFGSRLGLIGDEAQKFNKMAPDQRLHRINAELDKYQGAADRFGHSFIAQWTTLKDNIKYGFLSQATSPLFDHVKHTIGEINEYFDTHKREVEEVAGTVGRRLVSGWEAVETIVKRMGPLVGHFADELVHMQPAELAKKLEHAGEIGLAMKMAPTAIRAGSSMLGAMSGEGGAAGALGMLGVEALPVLAAAAVTTYGAVDDLTDKMNAYHDSAVKAAEATKDNLGKAADDLHPALTKVETMGQRAADALGWLGIKAAEIDSKELLLLVEGIQQPIDAFEGLRDRLMGVTDAANVAGVAIESAMAAFNKIRPEETASVETPGYDMGLLHGAAFESAYRAGKQDDKRGPAKGGGGGTHIDQLIVRVEGNQDPSRVARLVVAEIRKDRRNPKRDKYAPDYTANTL